MPPPKPESSDRVAYIYLPEGFVLASATRSDDSGFGGGTHENRQVLTFASDLTPGQTATATIAVSPASPAAQTVIADITPTLHSDQPTSVVARCGAA